MSDPMFLFAILAVALLGIAKGGFGGVGAPAALPIMALGVDPALALGALLPILMAMDVVSVSAHRKNADLSAIKLALPAAVIGVLLGVAVLAFVSGPLVAAMIGALAVGFALMGLTGYAPRIDGWPVWTNGVFGATSGLTSTVAHAGGPPIQIFLLTRGYAPAQFVATSALFMAGVNIIKVIPFIWVGALDRDAMMLALWMAPLAVVSAMGGVWVSRVIPKSAFRYVVNGLMLIVGLRLLWDAVL